MGKKLFKCDIKDCEKLFSSKFSLKRHNLIHLNKKNHECKFCNKKFSLLQYLEEHEYTHTGAKPFVCNVHGCQEQFRQRGKLSIHRKIYHQDALGAGKQENHMIAPNEEEKEDQIQQLRHAYNQHSLQNFQDQDFIQQQRMDTFNQNALKQEMVQQMFGKSYPEQNSTISIQLGRTSRPQQNNMRDSSVISDIMREIQEGSISQDGQPHSSQLLKIGQQSQYKHMQNESAQNDSYHEDFHDEVQQINNMNASYGPQQLQNFGYPQKRSISNPMQGSYQLQSDRSFLENQRVFDQSMGRPQKQLQSNLSSTMQAHNSMIKQTVNKMNLLEKQMMNQGLCNQEFQSNNNNLMQQQLQSLQQGNLLQMLQDQSALMQMGTSQHGYQILSAMNQNANPLDDNSFLEQYLDGNPNNPNKFEIMRKLQIYKDNIQNLQQRDVLDEQESDEISNEISNQFGVQIKQEKHQQNNQRDRYL